MMAVSVPLVDLRAQPRTSAQPDVHDPLEESQLFYGERVRLLKTQGEWAYVEATEQPEFTHARRWQGYPGWVPAKVLVPFDPLLEPEIIVTEKWASVWNDPYRSSRSPWRFSLGTRLKATDIGGVLWRVELLDGTDAWLDRPAAQPLADLKVLPPPERRRIILRNAQLFLGDAYYWGGRSPSAGASSHQVTGIDCSGLVNLAYRAAGIDIPRDAHEQFLRARPIETPGPADLIFLSERANPKRIVHVMLYAGEGEVIEGPGTGKAVHRIDLAKRLGRPLDELSPGAVIDEQTVFFGSYLP